MFVHFPLYPPPAPNHIKVLRVGDSIPQGRCLQLIMLVWLWLGASPEQKGDTSSPDPQQHPAPKG